MLFPRVVATREQELLLKAALLDGRDALDAWERWKELTGGIERHDANSYRVIPLLYRRLAPYAPDDPDLQRLKGVYRHTWVLNQRKLYEASRVLADLEQAGIQTLLLKGAALIALYYHDSGVRPMADFDILVPHERRGDAFALLHARGWRQTAYLTIRPSDLPVVKHAVALHRDEQELDLHWHALRVSADDRAFWEAACSITIGGTTTRALSPADQLFHVVVHGTSYWGAPVAWIADALTVIGAAGPNLDWQRLAAQATARGLTLRTAAALAYLRETFGAPVDDVALARLDRVRPQLAERVEYRALVHHADLGVSSVIRDWERWRRLRRRSSSTPGLVSYLAAGRSTSRRGLALHFWRKTRARRRGARVQSASPSS